jgi:hypothetical protein
VLNWKKCGSCQPALLAAKSSSQLPALRYFLVLRRQSTAEEEVIVRVLRSGAGIEQDNLSEKGHMCPLIVAEMKYTKCGWKCLGSRGL